MIQLLVHELIPAPDPVNVCGALANLGYRIFFDSAPRSGKYARYSFVAADPVAIIRADGRSSTILRKTGAPDYSLSEFSGNPLIALQELLVDYAFTPAPLLPPFQAGAAGYVGYEFGSGLEAIEQPANGLGLPSFCTGIYDSVFSWDHDSNRAWLTSLSQERQDFFLDCIREPGSMRPRLRDSLASPSVESSLSREEFRVSISAIREYIAAGDIFQANFSQRFRSHLDASPWELFLELRRKNPAPFSCFFDCGHFSILSASPERFIQVTGRHAETRPIKGTAPRFSDIQLDLQSGRALIDSAKDNAEHVMIVDVLRNDLSRVCKPGSVLVEELAVLESHPTVHHLVSTISGQLRDDRSTVDLLLASLPGGSITGAPKIRAMQIIAELEPVRREVYCGCMLYLTPSGEMDSSIVIRTFVTIDDEVFFSAGGGIVADSDPDAEFEETLHKAAALFSALQAVG